jgi:hypothetical protein
LPWHSLIRWKLMSIILGILVMAYSSWINLTWRKLTWVTNSKRFVMFYNSFAPFNEYLSKPAFLEGKNDINL